MKLRGQRYWGSFDDFILNIIVALNRPGRLNYDSGIRPINWGSQTRAQFPCAGISEISVNFNFQTGSTAIFSVSSEPVDITRSYFCANRQSSLLALLGITFVFVVLAFFQAATGGSSNQV